MEVRIVCYLLIFTIISSFANSYTPSFNETIAGKRTLVECMNGKSQTDSDLDITTVDMIKKFGYSVEEHVVLTEDGYILTIHRIPGKSNDSTPVFLQHGMMASSFDWVLAGKERGLAFLLADSGYDVWIGNVRGTVYSMCHTQYETGSAQFWNFSWHEIGMYDLPATITYVTNLTNQRIIYVGHSMGTTASFVMAIERPDIAAKVKVIFSLAPAAYLTHGKSSLRMFAPLWPEMEFLNTKHGEIGIVLENLTFKRMLSYFCSIPLVKRLCSNILFSAVGFDEEQFDYSFLPLILSHYPAGMSLKTFIHYLQVRESDEFQYYDYGSKNLQVYGSKEPPKYNISNIQVPVGLFWSENDYFCHIEDVKRFKDQLPNLILDYKVEHKWFNHLDFLFAKDARKYVFSKLISVMEDFRE